MRISSETLAKQAEANGFRPDMLEKVGLLLHLLDTIRSHPFLKDKLVLKGGTALNIFIFDVPRLSIDIDLNYVGAADREAMLAERPKIEEALQAVFSRYLSYREQRKPKIAEATQEMSEGKAIPIIFLDTYQCLQHISHVQKKVHTRPFL